MKESSPVKIMVAQSRKVVLAVAVLSLSTCLGDVVEPPSNGEPVVGATFKERLERGAWTDPNKRRAAAATLEAIRNGRSVLYGDPLPANRKVVVHDGPLHTDIDRAIEAALCHGSAAFGGSMDAVTASSCRIRIDEEDEEKQELWVGCLLASKRACIAEGFDGVEILFEDDEDGQRWAVVGG